jgi:hypothetical protein
MRWEMPLIWYDEWVSKQFTFTTSVALRLRIFSEMHISVKIENSLMS